MFEIDGPKWGPHGGGKPTKLVVLLHGYGADGEDLCGLAPMIGPAMPGTMFHAPNAPYPCDGNPMGFQWFGISRLDPQLTLAGVRGAAPFVDAFLDARLKEYGLTEADAMLVGFSQGTMMSLHVGLRRPTPLAGIVGFSGLLAGHDVLKDEMRSKPPVLLTHGDADPMLPADFTRQAARTLGGLGVDVKTHISPGVGHTIDQAGLQLAVGFMRKHLGYEAAR